MKSSRQRRTCFRGHPFTDLSAYQRPDGGRECRTCRDAASARAKAKIKSGLRVPVARKTHCVRGHARSAEQTYLNASGYRACRICRLIHRAKHAALARQRVAALRALAAPTVDAASAAAVMAEQERYASLYPSEEG